MGQSNYSRKNVNWIIYLMISSIPFIIFYLLDPSCGFFMEGAIFLIKYSLIITDGTNLLLGNIFNKNIPASEMYLCIFNLISAINFETIQRLPINYFLISVVLFCFANTLLNSKIIAALIAGIFAFRPAFDVADYSLFVKGQGLFFLVIYMLLIYKLYETKRPIFAAIALIVYVANHFFDYTAQFYMIIFTIPSMFFILYYRYKSTKIVQIFIVILLIIEPIMYLGFRTILANGYMPWVSGKFIGLALQNFTRPILSPIVGPESGYFYSLGSHLWLTIINLAFYLIIFLTILIYSIKFIMRFSSNRELNKYDIWIVCLILPGIVIIPFYLMIGLFVMGYILLIYPLICALCIFADSMNTKYGEISEGKTSKIITALFILSIISYIGVIGYGIFPATSNSNMNYSASWLFNSTDDYTKIISDYTTLGKYRSLWGSYGKVIDITGYDLNYYQSIVSLNSWNGISAHYLIIDADTTKPCIGENWINLKPLKDYDAVINMNKHINKIYYDGASKIFQIVNFDQ